MLLAAGTISDQRDVLSPFWTLTCPAPKPETTAALSLRALLHSNSPAHAKHPSYLEMDWMITQPMSAKDRLRRALAIWSLSGGASPQ